MYNIFSARGMEAGEVFADLEGLRVNGVIVPANIAITGQKPDIVIVKRQSSPPEVALVKLTVAWGWNRQDQGRMTGIKTLKKITEYIEEVGSE